jgi:HAD superfamily hydrolase (TIGR01509 family)
MFTAAIFDMDGLLLDSERTIMQAWLASARALDVLLHEADYIGVIGLAHAESTARLTALLGNTHDYERVQRDAARRLAPEAGTVFALKPGAMVLLQALRQRGVPCAVASSTQVAEVRRRLAVAGIDGFFRAVAGGDEVPRGKPDPAVYLLAAQRAGLDPHSSLAFEDSDHGSAAARAAGLQVVTVPDLKTPDAASSLQQLASLADALQHLDDWFPPAPRNTLPGL